MSEEDSEYLKNNPVLSASKIFQSALDTIRQNRKQTEEEIKVLNTRNEILTKKLTSANEFINEKGLWEEWRKLA